MDVFLSELANKESLTEGHSLSSQDAALTLWVGALAGKVGTLLLYLPRASFKKKPIQAWASRDPAWVCGGEVKN
jgi:hypothetical protein